MSVLRSRLLPAVVALIAATGVVGVTDAGAAATKAPRVSSVSPSSGPVAGGTRITVHGSHLSGASSVTIGGVPGHKIHVLSARALTVVVPKHTVGRYSVRVRSAKGRSASTSHSTYGYVSRPSVSKVRLIKGSGLAGSTIRVTGKNLANTRTVKVGRASARVVAHTSTTMDVRVPTNAPGRLHVTATTAGGTSTTQADDVYPMPAPVDQDWSMQAYLGLEHGLLSAVSCPTTSTCLAMDAYDAMYTISDGRWSEASHVPSSAGLRFTDALSCPTVDFCAATSAAGVAVLADGTWHPGPSASDLGSRGNDISCSSIDHCVWVGQHSYAVLDGGVWSAPRSTPTDFRDITCFSGLHCSAIGPTPSFYTFDGSDWTELPAPPRYGVAAGSCASESLCGVVTTDGWASVWDGSAWSEPAKLERGYDSFVAMSCIAATCVYNGRTAMHTWTAGSWTTGGSSAEYHLTECHTSTECIGQNDLGRIGSFDGTVWHATTEVLPRVGAGSSLDCVSATFCAMSDEAGNTYTFDGTGWTAPHHVGSTYYQHSAVSCVSATFCMATFADKTTAVWDGTGWNAAPSTQRADLGLACFSPTNCLAAGRSGSERFDGSSWTPVNSTAYRSLSCGGATFCAGVTAEEVQTYDGTTWHHAIDDPTLRYVDPHAVACPSASFCLLIDGVGREVTYRSGRWSDPVATLSQAPMTVACSSATACQAIGSDHNQTYNGRDWSAINASGDAVEAAGASALSCYAPGTCIAADTGVIFTSHPRG